MKKRKLAFPGVRSSFILVAALGAAPAGLSPQASPPEPLIWGSVGFGTSSPGLSTVFQAAYQRGVHTFGLRGATHMDGGFVLLGLAENTTIGELSLLYGLSTRKRWFNGTAWLGPAWVRRRIDPPLLSEEKASTDGGIGLTIVAEGAFTVTSFLGIGAQLFGTLNSIEPILGVAWVLRLGRVR